MSEDVDTAPITVRVAEDLKSALDETYEQRGFNSRENYIRFVLRNAVAEQATVTEPQAEDLRESRAQAQRGDVHTESEVADALGVSPEFLDEDHDSSSDS